MARVLPTGSQLNEDMKTSQSVTQPQSVRGAVTQGEKLSNDLQSIMAGGAKISQDYMKTEKTANVNFAQKSADESKVNLYKDLAALDANTTPDTDLRLKKDAQESLYQYYGNKIFDNEDAQKRFDDQYHNPVSVNIANRGAVLSKKANKNDHDKLVVNKTNDYRTMVAGGEIITTQTLTEFTNAMTAGGYMTLEDAQLALADEATTGFETKAFSSMGDTLNAAGYSAEVGMTNGVMSNVFNQSFSAFGTMEDGSIKWHENIGNKSREEINRKWKVFKTSVDNLSSDDVNVPLQVYKNQSSAVVSDAKAGKTKYTDLVSNQKELRKKVSDLRNPNAPSLSKAQNEAIIKQEDEMNRQVTIANYVQNVFAGDKDTVSGVVANGAKWTDEDGITYEVSEEYIKNQINTRHEEFSDGMTSNEIGSDGYTKNMQKAMAFENKTGIKNPTLKSYESGITGTGLFENAEQISKSADYTGKKNKAGGANSMLKNTLYVATVQKLQAQFANGDFANEQEYVTAVNFKMKTMRQGIFSRVDDGQFKKNWLVAAEANKDRWGHNITLNPQTINSLAYMFMAEGGGEDNTPEEYEKFIAENTVSFVGSGTMFSNTVGSFIPFADIKAPSVGSVMKNSSGKNLAAGKYEDGMNNIVRKYNENNPESEIAVSDLRVSSVYNGGKDQDRIVWAVTMIDDNGNSQPMGNFNGDDMEKMAGWSSKEEQTFTQIERDRSRIKKENITRREAENAASNIAPVQDAAMPVDTVEPDPVDNTQPEVVVEPEVESEYPSIYDKGNFKVLDRSLAKGEPEAITDESFAPVLQREENRKGNMEDNGWSKKNDKWYPHESSEGGTKTIAYGHKLDKDEAAGNYVMLDGKKHSLEKGLTDSQAKRVFKKDWNDSKSDAKKHFTESEWNKMTERNKTLATALVFNLGTNKFNIFKDFKKIVTGDEAGQNSAIGEARTSFKTKAGERKYLQTRYEAIAKWYARDIEKQG